MYKFLQRGAEAFGVLLFALLFLAFVVQVAARFVFNQPLAWTDEAAVILYLWAILWGAALVCKDHENVAFDLLYQKASPQVKRVMALAGCVLIGGLAAWGLPGSVDYIVFMQRESTPVMGLPFNWVFAPFALLLLALAVRYAWRIYRLLGKDWKAYL
ncbi:MAG: TRAP transporter small permease [Rhodoferax sp.]|uniref:TRAP transporter small permease n=1 Tax=Rhodoferax sp. TaxID=50421 RepID=UPI003016F7CF